MTRKRTVFTTMLALAALTLAVAACGGDAAAGDDSVTVSLGELTGSGQSGSATLTPAGEGRTTVFVEVGSPPEEAQPAHIHPGTCADLDPLPAYPLAPLAGGASQTTVSISLDDLRRGAFAVNVHLSEEEIRTSVACGDIPE
jgi:Cu/Zn superoxide dismutase